MKPLANSLRSRESVRCFDNFELNDPYRDHIYTSFLYASVGVMSHYEVFCNTLGVAPNGIFVTPLREFLKYMRQSFQVSRNRHDSHTFENTLTLSRLTC